MFAEGQNNVLHSKMPRRWRRLATVVQLTPFIVWSTKFLRAKLKCSDVLSISPKPKYTWFNIQKNGLYSQLSCWKKGSVFFFYRIIDKLTQCLTSALVISHISRLVHLATGAVLDWFTFSSLMNRLQLICQPDLKAPSVVVLVGWLCSNLPN